MNYKTSVAIGECVDGKEKEGTLKERGGMERERILIEANRDNMRVDIKDNVIREEAYNTRDGNGTDENNTRQQR